MKRTITRPLALAASAALVVGTAACTSGGDGGSTEDDNVITIFSQQGPDRDLNGSTFTKLIEEEFDVDLQFETTTWDAASAAEARQIALASGDLPDAFLLIPWVDQFSQAELVKYGEQGLIRPLNELIDSSAPNLQKAWTDTPDWEKLATAPDGNVWGLPQWNDCFHCTFPSKMWLNTAWLDALGLETPTTPDEFREVLKAFKEQDPNGNGTADEVPLTGATGGNSVLPFLMNPFVYVPTSTLNGAVPASLALDGSDVTLQPTLDGWRDGLRYVNSLFEEGLIDESAFTQNQDALLALGDIAGDPVVGAASVGHPGVFVTIGQEDERDRGYDAIAPLEGPNGSPASKTPSSVAGAAFVITNQASDAKAEKLMQIVDYMIDYDNHLRAEFGEENVGWAYAEEGDTAIDETLEPLWRQIRVSGAEANDNITASWGPLAQYYGDLVFRGSEVRPKDVDIYDLEGYNVRLFEETQDYAENAADDKVLPYWNMWIPEEESSELATTQTNVESLITQASAEFVTGVRDIDNDDDWQAFQDALVANGSDRYIEIYQKAYDAIS